MIEKGMKSFSTIFAIAVLLLIAFIILSIISLNYSIECKTTSIVKNGIVEIKETLDYPYSRKIIDIFSNLSMSALIGILISVLISKTIEQQRVEQEKRDIELKKNANEFYLRQLNEKVNESVFDALFKRIIPKEIFQVLKRDIINSDIIRHDSDWFLDFTVDGENKIILKFTNRYKAYNNCDKEIINPVSRLISTNHNTESHLEKVMCTLHDVILVNYDSQNPQDNNGVRIEIIDENVKRIHYDLKIPANHYVEYTTVFVNKYTDYVQDEFFTSLPQIDLNIIATYPSGYNFRIFPLLSSELKLKLNEKNRSIYKVEGGILPNQGIVYYLDKMK